LHFSLLDFFHLECLQMRPYVSYFLLIGAALFSSGCGEGGPSVASVSGTVTYQGQPVADAMVTFIPEKGTPGNGQTDASGKYTISTRGKNGAVLGLNKVTVTKMTTDGPAMPANPTPEDMRKAAEASARMSQTESQLPSKYGTAFSSGLTATVTSDESANVFDFDLTD
jgi:hypothetical protein